MSHSRTNGNNSSNLDQQPEDSLAENSRYFFANLSTLYPAIYTLRKVNNPDILIAHVIASPENLNSLTAQSVLVSQIQTFANKKNLLCETNFYIALLHDTNNAYESDSEDYRDQHEINIKKYIKSLAKHFNIDYRILMNIIPFATPEENSRITYFFNSRFQNEIDDEIESTPPPTPVSHTSLSPNEAEISLSWPETMEVKITIPTSPSLTPADIEEKRKELSLMLSLSPNSLFNKFMAEHEVKSFEKENINPQNITVTPKTNQSINSRKAKEPRTLMPITPENPKIQCMAALNFFSPTSLNLEPPTETDKTLHLPILPRKLSFEKK